MLVIVSLGPKDVDGQQVDGGVTKEDKNHVTISVTIDPSDQPLVNGRDAVTGAAVKDYSESIEETAEHEIAGHADDMINHNDRSTGGTKAENALRERLGQSFRRIGETGRVVPVKPKLDE